MPIQESIVYISAIVVVMATLLLCLFRYHPHQKLVGFMAPMEVGTVSDTARSVRKHAYSGHVSMREHAEMMTHRAFLFFS